MGGVLPSVYDGQFPVRPSAAQAPPRSDPPRRDPDIRHKDDDGRSGRSRRAPGHGGPEGDRDPPRALPSVPGRSGCPAPTPGGTREAAPRSPGTKLAGGRGQGAVPHTALRRYTGGPGSAPQRAYRPCDGGPDAPLRAARRLNRHPAAPGAATASVSRGIISMKASDRGLKHVCSACACKYYDLGNKGALCPKCGGTAEPVKLQASGRSEEHTSELQSLMRISYAVFCLKKKKTKTTQDNAEFKDND